MSENNNVVKNDNNMLLIKYFENRGLVGHSIDSFNKFLFKGMQRVVDEVKEIVPDIIPERVNELKIVFGRIWVEKPYVREADGTRRRIMPVEARLRKLTYAAPIMLEMKMIKDGVETEKSTVQIGELPILLKSDNCYLKGLNKQELIKNNEDPTDPGGYFIVNGTERVIVIIEDLAQNKVFVEDKKTTGPYPWVAKVFSDDGQYRIPHVFEKGKDGIIYLTFTRLKRIPLVYVMKALGLVKDKEISDAINVGEELQGDLYINLYKANEIDSQKKALMMIGKKMGVVHSEERAVEKAEEVIDKFLLPHIGKDVKHRKKKAFFLGRAVKKLLLVSYGRLRPDDKDHYANKRLKLSGDLMETLFRYSFRMLVGDMKYNFERLVKRGRTPSLAGITRASLLTSRIKSALATGEWMGGREGVSQHLDRINHYSMISHLRRVVSLLTSSRENFEARDLHPTHWGRLCVSETPEGPNVGLRKNLAVTSEISTEPEVSEEELFNFFKKNGMKELW